jgi:hypothetical protein
MKSALVLVCALADSPETTPGSDFSHTCAKCRRRVMIARSGQAFLKKKPHLVIKCEVCFFELFNSGKPMDIRLAADPQKILDECRQRIPNFWSRRQ